MMFLGNHIPFFLVAIAATFTSWQLCTARVITTTDDEFDLTEEEFQYVQNRLLEMQERWRNPERNSSYNVTDVQWAWIDSLGQYHYPLVNSSTAESDPRAVTHQSPQNEEGCDEITTQFHSRVEWRRMSDADRTSFIDAFNSLAQYVVDPSDPQMNGLHLLLYMHTFDMAPGAHNGASFLGWHREYLWRVSNALRQQGYTADLPYWDSILDRPLPEPADSAFWTEYNLGSSRGAIGQPFEDLRQSPLCDGDSVQRDALSPALAKYLMFSQEKLGTIFSYSCFRDWTWGWNSESNTSFESFHNQIHIYIGGDMSNVECAPNDPIFFLHHTYLDLLWEEFRKKYQKTNPETEYPLTEVGFLARYKQWNSLMRPFHGVRRDGLGSNDGKIMIEGLSNKYTNYFYNYDVRPSAIVCQTDRDCTGINGSDLLWCDVTTSFCRGKIKEGGRCDQGMPDKQCWCYQGNPACDQTSSQCVCQ